MKCMRGSKEGILAEQWEKHRVVGDEIREVVGARIRQDLMGLTKDR